MKVRIFIISGSCRPRRERERGRESTLLILKAFLKPIKLSIIILIIISHPGRKGSLRFKDMLPWHDMNVPHRMIRLITFWFLHISYYFRIIFVLISYYIQKSQLLNLSCISCDSLVDAQWDSKLKHLGSEVMYLYEIVLYKTLDKQNFRLLFSLCITHC